MTLWELVDRVGTAVGESDTPSDGLVAQLLNSAMERESIELQIPQKTVTLSVTGEFSLPSDARQNGVMEIRREEDDTLYPILNVVEANRRFPDWRDLTDGSTVFILYDPKMIGGDVKPVPTPAAGTPETYLMIYLVKPSPMVNKTDVPWEGRFPDYDEMLSFKVATDILMAQQRTQEAALTLQQYTQIRADLFAKTSPGPIYPNNPLHNAVWRS